MGVEMALPSAYQTCASVGSDKGRAEASRTMPGVERQEDEMDERQRCREMQSQRWRCLVWNVRWMAMSGVERQMIAVR